MRKQPHIVGQEESMASRWVDLMQYENGIEKKADQGEGGKDRKNEKFQKFKENTSKRFSFIKTQITELCRYVYDYLENTGQLMICCMRMICTI